MPRKPRDPWTFTHRLGNCLIWTGYLLPGGYGKLNITVKREDGTRFQPLAHRWFWEQENGPVPEGMELDHLCRNRACVKVEHLELVTRKENVRRGLRGILKTECINGHPWIGPASWYEYSGKRMCRACASERQRRYLAKKKGK